MKSLFHSGLFTAHDIWHQVARLYHYSQAFNDGQFPPYWIATLANGLGYPLFFFSYHLPWILGLTFLKIGFDIPTTLKILFFLAYFFSGIFMYLFVKSLLQKRLPALLSAIIYLWSPYHFLTILVGASIGIVFVFTFLPLLLLGIHLIKEGKKSGIPIAAIGLSGIILSHLMHLVFLSPVIIVFTIWGFISTKKKDDFIKNATFGLILGLLLSAFYLIPAVYYNQFTKINQTSGLAELYKRNFVNFSQIIYSKWGYGPIISTAKNGEMSVQLGIAQWLAVLGISILLCIHKFKTHYMRLSIFLFTGFLISIFLMLDYSLPIWQIVEKFVTLDFPFRELLGATFAASVIGGILLANLQPKIQKITFVLIILIALYTNRNHIKVNLYTDIPVNTYVASETTTNSFNEYLPIQTDSKLLNSPGDFAEGVNLKISNTKQTSASTSFTIDALKESTMSARQLYFPGQTLYLDQKKTPYDIDQKGRISFYSPAGIHNVVIKYEAPPLLRISQFLTISGVIILLILLSRKKQLSK